MKKDSNELDHLFRSKLEEYKIPVERDLWGELQSEIPLTVHRRKMWYTKVAAAASVLLILTASSAAFWLLSPKQETIETFSQVATGNITTGTTQGDAVHIGLPSLPPAIAVATPSSQKQVTPSDQIEYMEEDTLSISFSMSFTISTTSSSREGQSGYYNDGQVSYYTQSAGGRSTKDSNPVEANTDSRTTTSAKRPWSLQAAMGTALPADHGKHKMPFMAEVTAEKQITDRLSAGAGLRYSLLHSEETFHYIGIPLNVKYTCYRTDKLALYATVGGIAEKCIAGAADNGFSAEPIQLGITAGVGARYQLNDRLALFAEPGVSHHFQTDSRTQTIRSERPTNFNLLCGVRMTY